MASLLETIAKRLLGTDSKLMTKTAYNNVSAKRQKQDAVVGSWEKPSVASQEIKQDSEIKDEIQRDDKLQAFDRTFKRERTSREVEREDLLLSQIDEFREKAQQLQSLLLSKESKVAELQNIVDEREGKAKELESILHERQRQADGIAEEMTKQIDVLIGKVSAKMDAIGNSIANSVNDNVGKGLEESRQLSEKQLEELQELRDLLETITPQLETVKTDLSDKIHSENVKCYRNILDLFKSVDSKMDQVDEVQQNVSSVRKFSIAIMIFTIVNMLGITALALYELGVFQLLLGE